MPLKSIKKELLLNTAGINALNPKRVPWMRLLVVEDEKKVANFIRKGLAEEGYAVDLAHDGEEGLGMALDQVHDLIILDISLPKMDGIAVLK